MHLPHIIGFMRAVSLIQKIVGDAALARRMEKLSVETDMSELRAQILAVESEMLRIDEARSTGATSVRAGVMSLVIIVTVVGYVEQEVACHCVDNIWTASCAS